MEIKDRIKQKAQELFRMYGVRSVTMDDIALQLGVSKKTLYQSFSDKSELVDEVTRNMLEDNRSNCITSRSHADNAIHELFLALESLQEVTGNMNPGVLFDLQRGYPKTFQRFQDFKYDFLYDVIAENLRWGKEDGLFREDVNEEVYAKMRLEMISIPFNEQLFPKTKFSLVYLQEQTLKFFIYAIVTPKGYKLIDKYINKNQVKQTNPKQ